MQLVSVTPGAPEKMVEKIFPSATRSRCSTEAISRAKYDCPRRDVSRQKKKKKGAVGVGIAKTCTGEFSDCLRQIFTRTMICIKTF